MAGKTIVARWWDMLRYRYYKRLGIPAKPYAELTTKEQSIVWSYYSTGKIKS